MSTSSSTVSSARVQGGLPVGDGHVIAWEQCGALGGMPVVVLHGGPGRIASQALHTIADQSAWCVTSFDQRGCGNSRATDDLHANTTAHLVADIEALRLYLGVHKWYVAGEAWGAALALAYAAAHPDRVSGVMLRDPFLAGREEIFRLFDRWATPFDWPAAMPLGDRLAAVSAALNGPAAETVVRAWRAREKAVQVDTGTVRDCADEAAVTAAELRCYSVRAHYLASGCFLDMDEVMAGVALARVPVTVLHSGCGPDNARRLTKALPECRLHSVQDAVRSPDYPAMQQAWLAVLAQACQSPSANEHNYVSKVRA